jgi:hypothetical protein
MLAWQDETCRTKMQALLQAFAGVAGDAGVYKRCKRCRRCRLAAGRFAARPSQVYYVVKLEPLFSSLSLTPLSTSLMPPPNPPTAKAAHRAERIPPPQGPCTSQTLSVHKIWTRG